MSETTILEQPYVRVTYHPEYKLVKVTWNGTPTREQYIGAITAALDFQQKSTEAVENYMSDITRQGVVNPESRKWFEKVAVPRGIQQGLKRGVVVSDDNVFKRYYLNLIIQAINVFKLPLKIFKTQDEAIKWIQSFY